MRGIYRLLSILGDVKAARRGPGPLVRRQARKQINRAGNRRLRRWLKP